MAKQFVDVLERLERAADHAEVYFDEQEPVDQNGLYADFHSNRHLFITSLERAGIRPKMAQTLARHSDVRLTLGVYTHVTVEDQTAAIELLPGPPVEKDERGGANGERPDNRPNDPLTRTATKQ